MAASACEELLHAEFPTLDPDLQNYVQGMKDDDAIRFDFT